MQNNYTLTEDLISSSVIYSQNKAKESIDSLSLKNEQLKREGEELKALVKLLENQLSGNYSSEIENLKSDLNDCIEENIRINEMLAIKEANEALQYKIPNYEEYQCKILELEDLIKTLLSEKEALIAKLRIDITRDNII